MIVHVAFEVSDLDRSARFYDAIFYSLGARRLFESDGAIAYGRDREEFWIVERGRRRPPASAMSRSPPRAARRSTARTPPASSTAGARTGPRVRGRSTARRTTPAT
jgi:catechol 2,3-dioxygenase-like lactoylglutathione lyase family enzyme